MKRSRDIWRGLLASLAFMIIAPAAAQQQQPKPNILVIMGDDIGYWNISAYNRGQMGYRTPNIDRIANEGAIFTDYYGQQSCTAGRAAFITGQSPMRTGLLKVGLPGAKEGLSEKDPTLAELLKPQGYLTGNSVRPRGNREALDEDPVFPCASGLRRVQMCMRVEPEHVAGTTQAFKYGPATPGVQVRSARAAGGFAAWPLMARSGGLGNVGFCATCEG